MAPNNRRETTRGHIVAQIVKNFNSNRIFFTTKRFSFVSQILFIICYRKVQYPGSAAAFLSYQKLFGKKCLFCDTFLPVAVSGFWQNFSRNSPRGAMLYIVHPFSLGFHARFIQIFAAISVDIDEPPGAGPVFFQGWRIVVDFCRKSAIIMYGKSAGRCPDGKQHILLSTVTDFEGEAHNDHYTEKTH